MLRLDHLHGSSFVELGASETFNTNSAGCAREPCSLAVQRGRRRQQQQCDRLAAKGNALTVV